MLEKMLEWYDHKPSKRPVASWALRTEFVPSDMFQIVGHEHVDPKLHVISAENFPSCCDRRLS